MVIQKNFAGLFICGALIKFADIDWKSSFGKPSNELIPPQSGFMLRSNQSFTL